MKINSTGGMEKAWLDNSKVPGPDDILALVEDIHGAMVDILASVVDIPGSMDTDLVAPALSTIAVRSSLVEHTVDLVVAFEERVGGRLLCLDVPGCWLRARLMFSTSSRNIFCYYFLTTFK